MYNIDSMKEKALDRFLRLRAEKGHIAPTYFYIGENVYEELRAEILELQGVYGHRDMDVVTDFTELCGVPVIIDYTNKNSLGAYYRFW